MALTYVDPAQFKGPVLDVKRFGAVGDGSHDDTSAIIAAVAALPLNGGQVMFPDGDYIITDTIVAGNGTSLAESTRNGIHFVGYGPGATPSQGGAGNATRIIWAGSAGGTMFRFDGPIYNTGMNGICLYANGIAATAIQTNHATGIGTQFYNLALVRCTGYAVVETAYTALGVYGASVDWADIAIDFGGTGGANSSGFNIGPSVFTTLDVARSSYTRIEIITGASGTGFQINAADALIFRNIFVLNSLRSIYFNPPSGVAGSTNFPINIIFYRTALNVTPTWNGSWTGTKNIQFFDYLQEEDNFSIPQPPFPIMDGISGYTSFGARWNSVPAIPVFANNAAAITGGLKRGQQYRTGADPDVLCIVH